VLTNPPVVRRLGRPIARLRYSLNLLRQRVNPDPMIPDFRSVLSKVDLPRDRAELAQQPRRFAPSTAGTRNWLWAPLHHVTQRGNRREAAFFEDGDHEIATQVLLATLKSRYRFMAFDGPGSSGGSGTIGGCVVERAPMTEERMGSRHES
jgi:hypothetical protein